MEIEPLEPAALPDLTAVRRRRPVRIALAVAGLTAAAGIAVAIGGNGHRPPAVQTATAPEESAGAPVDLADSVDPTTTTEATLGTTSSTVGPSTTATHRPNPTSTTARPSTTTTTRTTGIGARGMTLNADQPGVWVADLATGTLRRVADAGPFDVAGDFVLTAKGRQVFATPLTGGDTVLRYEAPGQTDPAHERVEWIDAGADGSAVVAIFAPVSGGAGGNYFLLDPSGRHVSTDWIGHNFAWSADGTKLAFTSLSATAPPLGTPPTVPRSPRDTLVVLNADGSVLRAAIDTDEVQGLNELRWAGDGRSLLFRGRNGGPVYRYDLESGRISVVPGKPQSIDIGPDGRILTTRYVPENDMAVDFLDPVTGALTPFLSRGDSPSWSPDGRSVLVASIPPPHYGNTPYRLAVFDTGGTARYTITIPDRLAFGQGGVAYRSQYPQAPQWSVSGRYVVFAVYPR